MIYLEFTRIYRHLKSEMTNKGKCIKASSPHPQHINTNHHLQTPWQESTLDELTLCPA
uniref:Uncharacterized protein n=1 Tax=Arundo donax TaxID=35708 RepID=A0A0A8Y595_ARUDO